MSRHSSRRQEQTKLIEKLNKQQNVQFTKDEIERLICMYSEFPVPATSKRMDRIVFRDFLTQQFKMTDDLLLDRIFRSFDHDSDNIISQEEWVTGLSVFLNPKHPDVIKFCFCVYDLNGDGYITREEMFHLLKSSIVKQATEEDSEESIKDLVEINLKMMDLDHDGRLSLTDFEGAVNNETLLLECLGPCLPSQQLCGIFRKKICGEK